MIFPLVVDPVVLKILEDLTLKVTVPYDAPQRSPMSPSKKRSLTFSQGNLMTI